MTKKEILNGMSEKEFYRLYPDQKSWENAQQMKLGGLSGAPHNGQPTADQFFNYGSHVNDAVNVPMSNPFYAANGGTPYYGGPIRPYAYGGGMDYFDEGGPNKRDYKTAQTLTPEQMAFSKANLYPTFNNIYNTMLKNRTTDQIDELGNAGADIDLQNQLRIAHAASSGKPRDPGTYAKNLNNLFGENVIAFPTQPGSIVENWQGETEIESEPSIDEANKNISDNIIRRRYLKDFNVLNPQKDFEAEKRDQYYNSEEMAYGGYMDMGGNTASPMNYGAFNVPMMYGGDEDQFGGSLNENNNQQYPILDSGGLGEFADGGDTSALVKIIIAAGKARKKALGGDTVTQGGNSDNYAENLRNSFQGAIKNNIERNKIEKSLESLTGMQKAYGGSSNQFNDGGYANNEYTPDKNFNSNVYDPRKLEIASMYGQNAQNAENDFTNSFNDFSNFMFKENGGLIKAVDGFEQWAQRVGKLDPNSPLLKKQVAPFYGQKNYFGNTSLKSTGVAARVDDTDTEDTQDFDPKKAKTYRFRVNNAAGENYYKNNPNSYYKVNQRNAKRLNSLPEGYGLKSVENQYGAGARLASNVVGLFGGKEKGAKTLNRFAPKKIKYNFGKIDGSGTTQGDTTKQDATQTNTTAPKSNLVNGMPNYLYGPGMQSPVDQPGRIDALNKSNQNILQSKQIPRQNYKDTDYEDYMNNMSSSSNSSYKAPFKETYNAGYKDMSYDDGLDYMNNSQSLLPPSQQGNTGSMQNQNELKPGMPEYDNRNSAENNIEKEKYGGGLRKLRRYAGDVEGNEVDKDNPVGMEDISVTAKRKSDIDTSRIGMTAPVAFNMVSSAKNEIAAQSAAQNTTIADKIKSINEGKDLGNFTVNQDAFRPNESQYGRFYGSAPADYGTPVIRYGGNAYQEGGGPEQGQQEQIMQGVATMLQQGAQPEQVAQQLVQMGIPQEQVMQIIQAVMQQMQGGQGQPMQPAMRYGGYAMGGSSDEDDEYYEADIDEDEIDRLQKLGYTVQRY